MSKTKTILLLAILLLGAMLGNSFTLGFGLDANGYNVSFTNDKEIFVPEKNETVFSLLNPQGDVIETRVVNRLSGKPGPQHKWVLDYGQYNKVNNLVSAVEAYGLSDRLFWPAELLAEGDIYYEGYTDKSLPVQVSIDYFLDEMKVVAKDLPGESGALTIRIRFKNLLANRESIHFKDSPGRKITRDDESYVPLVTQGTIPMDLRRFSEITVSNGAVVEVGRTANVSFMAFPFPDTEVVIRAIGQDITLEPMSISVMPQMPPVEGLEMADDLKALLAGLNKLQNGMNDIYVGLEAVTEGTDLADQGMKELLTGVAAGLAELEQGVSALAVGMGELHTGLEQADAGIEALFSGLTMGTGQMAEGLMDLYEASDQMLTGLEQLRDEMNNLAGPLLPLLEQIDGILAYLEQVDAERTAELLQGVVDLMDELLIWIRALPAQDLQNTISAHQKDISGLTLSTDEQEQIILEISRLNKDIVAAAEMLIADYPEGSDLHNLGTAILDQNRQIEALEQQMQEMKKALANVRTSGTLLESQTDELVDQILEKLTEIIGEIAQRYDMDPEYYEQLLQDLQTLIEYVGQIHAVLPALREQIAELSQLPQYMDQLVEGQRMIRDGIKLVHDQGVLELNRGLQEAASLFSLQEALLAIEIMSAGMDTLIREGFEPLQAGLTDAGNQLSLTPLVDAQKQIQRGLERLIREGMIPMRSGLAEGVDELLYAEEKLNRMQRMADSYRSFANNEKNMQSTVRFIMQTQAIQEQDPHSDDGTKTDTERPWYGLIWERLIALFKISP